jgi:hypothetical protein
MFIYKLTKVNDRYVFIYSKLQLMLKFDNKQAHWE